MGNYKVLKNKGKRLIKRKCKCLGTSLDTISMRMQAKLMEAKLKQRKAKK